TVASAAYSTSRHQTTVALNPACRISLCVLFSFFAPLLWATIAVRRCDLLSRRKWPGRGKTHGPSLRTWERASRDVVLRRNSAGPGSASRPARDHARSGPVGRYDDRR